MLLWRLLAAFFSLSVGDPEPEPTTPEPTAEPTPEPTPEPTDDDDGTLEAALDTEETPDPQEARRRERNQELERVAEEAARRAVAPKPQPFNFEQQQREREDAELEAFRQRGATREQLENKLWEINTNRTLRQSDQKSTEALARAYELNDLSEFRALATDPKQSAYYRAYKDRVEKRLAEERAQGRNINRITLMKYLIGEDRLEGKIKTKAAPKKETSEELPRNVTRIERGRSPGTGSRGDVGASGKQTRLQELTKRLEGKRI